MLNETLLQEIKTLSPDCADEVLDFIGFLRLRRNSIRKTPPVLLGDRKISILDGKASFRVNDDDKITVEEFPGL